LFAILVRAGLPDTPLPWVRRRCATESLLELTGGMALIRAATHATATGTVT
jgi:hypothetical protein